MPIIETDLKKNKKTYNHIYKNVLPYYLIMQGDFCKYGVK